ncbi:MAG: L-threonylcarbamoyladenylate synthase [Candidatus Saccharibacteria bacterium]|nr:L-threonylcarbamoyladenylate synthase [Candidatus Saccharibacteria bacterium]
MKICSEKEIDALADILKADGIISVPTDTVYGVCVRINSREAYDKLVKAKNRPFGKSFPVVCLNKAQIEEIAIINQNAEKLIHAFMPGPLTMVLNKKPEAFSYVNNSGSRFSDELAVRIAPSKALGELIRKVGSPLFLTSANLSGEEVCSNLEDIKKTFPTIDGILEGSVSFGRSSTIVDCTSDKIKIQRQGPITLEAINKVLRSS